MPFPPNMMIIGLKAKAAMTIQRQKDGSPRSKAMPRTCQTAPAMKAAAMNVPAWLRVNSGGHRLENNRIGISERLGSGFPTKPMAAKWGSG